MEGFDQLTTIVTDLFGAAIASEFTKTLALFTFAAWVHSKSVSKAINAKFDELIYVFKADHEQNKKDISDLKGNVAMLNKHLNIKGE